MNELLTILSVINTALIGALIVFLLKFKRSIPDIQQVLDDVGENIGEQFKEIFEGPAVSKAMSVLGKKSGEARADNALRNKAAGIIMDRMPGLGMVLDQFGLTPMEGVKLLNDPLFGPLIQRALGAVQKGLGGLGSSSSLPSSSEKDNVFRVS